MKITKETVIKAAVINKQAKVPNNRAETNAPGRSKPESYRVFQRT